MLVFSVESSSVLDRWFSSDPFLTVPAFAKPIFPAGVVGGAIDAAAATGTRWRRCYVLCIAQDLLVQAQSELVKVVRKPCFL